MSAELSFVLSQYTHVMMDGWMDRRTDGFTKMKTALHSMQHGNKIMAHSDFTGPTMDFCLSYRSGNYEKQRNIRYM